MLDKKIRDAAIAVVSEYIGVAAEFVVDDAIDATVAEKALSDLPRMQLLLFFRNLENELPPEVPFLAVRKQIILRTGIQV